MMRAVTPEQVRRPLSAPAPRSPAVPSDIPTMAGWFTHNNHINPKEKVRIHREITRKV